MFTFVDEPTENVGDALPSVFDDLPRSVPAARSSLGRQLALLTDLLTVPAAAGVPGARTTTPQRRITVGRLAAIAIDALRVELARWITPEPAFDSMGTLGDLELRRYDAHIEACAWVDDPAIETAIDQGYGWLASYLCGTNQTGELFACTTPILTTMRDGCYTVSLAMPPGRTLDELPQPCHPGIELRKVPARGIAALRFRGRCTRDNLAAHERVLLGQLADSGLSARDSELATFDSPLTLPILRRNELWIEIV